MDTRVRCGVRCSNRTVHGEWRRVRMTGRSWCGARQVRAVFFSLVGPLFFSGVVFSFRLFFGTTKTKQRWSDGRVERSNIRPGQHNCQRKRTVGLAAPAGKIATDASLTCGRVGSSPATLCVFFTSLSFLFCSRKERAKQSFR